MFAQESVMDIQEEREAFEAYMAEKYKSLMDRRQCLNNGGGYMAWDMNVAWQVWQAATAQAVPEGFVLAPKQPTEKMIDAGHDFCKNNIVTPSGFYKAMIEAQEQSHE